MTPKEINDLKRSHNALMKQGDDYDDIVLELQEKVTALRKRIEAEEGDDYDDIVLELQEKVTALRKQIEAEEGDDYDGIPLIFGDGFWIDPELP